MSQESHALKDVEAVTGQLVAGAKIAAGILQYLKRIAELESEKTML